MVNSGNFAYVILARRSSASVESGTSSGVFPAAHRMLATLCVLNMCGASSHARTTAASSASPVSRDTRQRIVEMAQMTFESSMLLNPSAAPGDVMYAENARAVAGAMPFSAMSLDETSPPFRCSSCFFSTASAHIELETPCGMNASPRGGRASRSRIAPSSASVARTTRTSRVSSSAADARAFPSASAATGAAWPLDGAASAPGPLCIFASAHAALDRFCDENAAPSKAATLRSRLAKRFGQCAEPLAAARLDPTPSARASPPPPPPFANDSAVLPQLAKPHSAQDTSRAPHTPWNSAALGCEAASGAAKRSRDASSAASSFWKRGSSTRRAASCVRRPRAERLSFPSLWIAVEKFTAVNVRACASAYSSTASQLSHDESVPVCCRILFLRAAAAGDAGSGALFRPPRDSPRPPDPPRPPWRRSGTACAPEPGPAPPRARWPRGASGPRRPSP